MTDEIFNRKNRISLYEKPKQNLKGELSAIAMLGCGYVGVLIENDATALVFLAMFAVPLFFAKENWIY